MIDYSVKQVGQVGQVEEVEEVVEVVEIDNSVMLAAWTPEMGSVLSDLLALMQKFHSTMRDTHRALVEQLQGVQFQNKVRALETKGEGADMKYAADTARAVGTLLGGLFGFAGAPFPNPAVSSLSNGANSTMQGITGLNGATGERESEVMKLLGEFQADRAGELGGTLDKSSSAASEASRRVREVTQDIVVIKDKMAAAVGG